MRKAKAPLVAAGAIIIGALLLNQPGAIATHEPANKVSAAGSTTEVAGPNETVVLMSERVKTSATTDLILSVSAECAITTALRTVGDDHARAAGNVQIWVEIDGTPVGVDSADETGRVVFCRRVDEREMTGWDDDDEDGTIRTFQETRQANAFNWMALDVGSATHLIEVKARLFQETPVGDATATMAVGRRTLIVEPVKAAGHEAVTEIG